MVIIFNVGDILLQDDYTCTLHSTCTFAADVEDESIWWFVTEQLIALIAGVSSHMAMGHGSKTIYKW